MFIQITQIKFLLIVHLSSLKYRGNSNGIITVVIKPAIAPQELMYTENIKKSGLFSNPKGLSSVKNKITTSHIGKICLILFEGRNVNGYGRFKNSITS